MRIYNTMVWVVKIFAVVFSIVIGVLTYNTLPSRDVVPSGYGSRVPDVRSAFSIRSGRLGELGSAPHFRFSALGRAVVQHELPAIIECPNNEYCIAIGLVSFDDLAGDSLVRCIDSNGSVTRRTWTDLVGEGSGIATLDLGRPVVAKIGEGEVRFEWLFKDFGIVTPESPRSTDFKLTNTGAVTVVVDSVRVSCQCIETKERSEMPAEINCGDSMDFAFSVGNFPQGEASLSVLLTIKCKNSVEQVELRLFASGGMSSI